MRELCFVNPRLLGRLVSWRQLVGKALDISRADNYSYGDFSTSNFLKSSTQSIS